MGDSSDKAYEKARSTIDAIFKNAEQRHADFQVMSKEAFIEKHGLSDWKHERGGFLVRIGRWAYKKLNKGA